MTTKAIQSSRKQARQAVRDMLDSGKQLQVRFNNKVVYAARVSGFATDFATVWVDVNGQFVQWEWSWESLRGALEKGTVLTP